MASASRYPLRPHRYGAPAPTPEQVLHDEAVPVAKVLCFAAGAVREIPVKVVRMVCWRKAGRDLPLLPMVIKPLGYRLRKGSKLLYRQPAFLICTAYVDRWEIECNHRDEKSLIGTAQGQVWNPLAVARRKFQVAIYNLLLFASIPAYGQEVHSPFDPGPAESGMLDNPTLSIDDFAALAPVDENSRKPPLGSETLFTFAA